jgi:CRP/FNR family transcriptional regulator, cyclic AMP receptor protein
MHSSFLEFLPSDGSLGKDRTYRGGAILWGRHKRADSIFVVKRGEIEIIVPGHKSHETVIRLVKPGEIGGLFCLFVNARESAHTTGRATVRTDVLEIQREHFEAFLKRNPDAALFVLVGVCERLVFAEERIRVLAQHRAEDRILALLLQLAERSGRANPGNPDLVRVQYTHTELARLSGMNRAHLSVVLNRLRERDIVRYGRGVPTCVNMSALRQNVEPQATPGIR